MPRVAYLALSLVAPALLASPASGILGQDYALEGRAPAPRLALAEAEVAAGPPAPLPPAPAPARGWIGIIDPVKDVTVTALPAYATLDPHPELNLVEHPMDGHAYTDLGTPRFLQLGTARGTVVGPDGSLRLAPGRRKGAWLSPVHREPQRFDYLQTGIRGRTPGGSRAKVYVRAYGTNGQQSRWMRVRREQEYVLPMLADFVQILIILLSGFGGQSPVLGGITIGTSVLGQGSAPPIFYPPGASGYPPGKSPGYPPGYPPSYPPSYPGAGPANPINPGTIPSQPSVPSLPSLPQGQGQPSIITREQWGASAPTGGNGGHRPSSITIHHSEGPNSSYAGAATVKGIQRFHQVDRGWGDIGYHFLIGPDGKIFEGRKLELVGAHSPPNNGRVGICLLGSFMRIDQLTSEAMASLLDLMTWLCRSLGIDPGAQVFGHRDQRSTDCPGDRVYAQIPAFQQETRRRLGY